MAIDLLGLSVSSPLLVPFSSSSSSALTSDTRLRSNYLTSSSQLHGYPRRVDCCRIFSTETFPSLRSATDCTRRRKLSCIIPGSASSSPPDGGEGESKASDQDKVPFGYSRKDVLLIGVGVTVIGVGLKSGLEFVGVDPLQAGNVVQLVMVLGLTVGWISTYIFRVSNKEMTYAQQLRDYENKVIQKRLEGLTEAELEALLQQVEEEKQQLPRSEQVN